MSHRTGTRRCSWKERALSLLLTAALMVGLLPGLTLPASAEHWADSFMDQLVDWGVLRADQTSNPDAPLTRAEFMAVVNRAYGYTEKGPIPFEDVLPTDWFYDDVSIAYTAGYMAGTSASTAAPNDTLTREQAVCILGRNMMMKETPGESLAFADSREISDWARGTVKTAVDSYIISGYPDNTFQPQSSISLAQMAVLVTQCVGNPIQESGTYELGGIFGNVTITAPNVTLRNTVISGDLYVSGGVGLGGIKLENVDVLGRIIVSSTGESEGGAASVIMRNVTANEMLVDNMRGKTVTVRADGITDIAKTVVRTNAYLEDNNTDDKGLMRIDLDGDPGMRLTLAGRIKEVIDKTPSSYIQVAKGTVAKLTMDEAAPNSTVQIDRNAKVNELNLDVATSVLGDGDIGQLNINAPGSVVTMLPDSIYIRPGLTASIAGVIMDYQAAEEGSLDPRLLSGYPAAKDISPTGFRADFASNKKGTIYWAVSYVSDGSIGEDALITPPSYGSKAIANGSVAAPAGGDEVSAQVANLVIGGSYYLSAVVVDEQNNRSPVKVISFSTPDNTVPAFATGYPYMSRTTRDVAQVTVMPTKSCKLYYALLPQGAQAPTANDLKAAAVTGNLGYGVRDVTKNTEDVFTVNSQRLEELKNYVLYLWLTDVDGANSSAVQALPFTIPDETPPIVDPVPYSVAQGTTENTIAMRSGLNENGTIFWAVVPHGEPYPLPNLQSDPLDRDNVLNENDEAVSSKLTVDYAKLCVTSGRGALISGSVAVTNPDNEVSFNITGLLPETAYDLYYVGRDTAGNYSEEVKMIIINTLDTSGPIVTLYFINPDKSTTEADGMPPANATIVLDFSERITVDGTTDLLTLNGTQQLVDKLKANFILHQLDPINPAHELEITDLTYKAGEKDALKAAASAWIDYEKVIVQESKTNQGHIEVIFPGGSYPAEQRAVSLANGRTYFFSLDGIKDTSGNYPPGVNGAEIKIPLTPENTENTEHTLPRFTTAFASVSLSGTGSLPFPVWAGGDAWTGAAGKGAKDQAKEGIGTRTDNGTTYQPTRMDAFFTITPESTEGMSNETYYDIVLFADQDVGYDLYYRIVDTTESGTPALQPTNDPNDTTSKFAKYKLPGNTLQAVGEKNGWLYLGNYDSARSRISWKAVSAVNTNFIKVDMNYPQLNRLGEGLRYEFAISVTSKGGDDRYKAWDGTVNFDVYVMAGAAKDLADAVNGPNNAPEDYVTTLNLQSIGIPNPPGYITVSARFSDSIEPIFMDGSPEFGDGDIFQILKFWLNPTGSTLYYRIAPVESPLPTTIKVYNEGDLSLSNTLNSEKTLNAGGLDSDFYKVIKKQTELATKQTTSAKAGEQGKLVEVTESDEGHLTYYKVVEDTNKTFRKAIANMNNSYPNNFPGYETYDFSNGQKELRLPDVNGRDTQLKPNTDYYIYIVLESASGNQESLSQVYIYTFKTAQTAKPKITLRNAYDGQVGITTHVSSNVRYIMLTPTALDKTVFSNNNTTETWYKTGTPDAYQGYTILQALMSKVSSSDENDGYTVFDAYAKDEIKAQAAQAIRNSAGADAIPGGAETEANKEVIRPEDTSQMKPGENYYVIAVAYNSASEEGIGDTFAAIKDIQVPNRVVPYVTSIVTSADRTGNYYKGTVTITFSDPLYWVPDANTTTAIPVLNAKAPGDGTTWKSILDNMGGSALGKMYVNGSAPAVKEASRTFTLRFDTEGSKLTLSENFIIFASGRIANSGGYSTDKSIIFTLVRDPNKIIYNEETGLEVPGGGYSFEARWQDENEVWHTLMG